MGGSLFWRSVCKHFHWLHDGLAWQIGDGKLLCIGLDPFTGIKDDSFILPEHMVVSLQTRGYGRLDNIIHTTTGSPNYWFSSSDFGFTGDDEYTWDRYIDMLRHHGIRLTNQKDQLIWDIASDGIPSAKSLYDHLIKDHCSLQIGGWRHSIWHKHIPLKILCFWWLVLDNAILTWDNLIKREHFGPGICVLCSDGNEDINHIFVHCKYTRYIWSRLEEHYNLTLNWGTHDINGNFIA